MRTTHPQSGPGAVRAHASPNGAFVDASLLAGLNALARGSSDLVMVGDSQGRLLWCNRAPSAEAQPGADVASLFPPEFMEPMHAAQNAVLDGSAEERLEWGLRDGAEVRTWYVCDVAPVWGAARQPGFLSRSTDVTALKRSEERLRRSDALMIDSQEAAQLGTWEWNVDQPRVTWSAQLYRIYGLDPATHTPTYEAYLTRVHPDDRLRVMSVIDSVFHNLRPFSHDERVFRPDGSLRYLHTWTRPVLDSDGRLVKLIGVCQDVTERTLAEQEVLKLNHELELRVAERTQQLQSSLEDLESFNAMVSHDLRTPLTAIALNCGLLEHLDGQLPARAGVCVRRIRRSADRMGELIRDLLSLSSVQPTALNVEPVDLGALAEDVVAGLFRANPGRRVNVQIHRGLMCRGDPGLLRTVLENLLGNAWKYTAKTAHPRIEVGSVVQGGDFVFFVRDNGVGFEMEQAGRLFRPFARLHDSEDYSGTGIGLVTVGRIIVRHRGRIWVQAQPGHGATFFFVLGALDG